MNYFTMLVKENDSSSLKKFTEMLTDGYFIDNCYNIGRSTLFIFRKRHTDLTPASVPEGITLRSSYGEMAPYSDR